MAKFTKADGTALKVIVLSPSANLMVTAPAVAITTGSKLVLSIRREEVVVVSVPIVTTSAVVLERSTKVPLEDVVTVAVSRATPCAVPEPEAREIADAVGSKEVTSAVVGGPLAERSVPVN
jgi:prephenate dehydrogenase